MIGSDGEALLLLAVRLVGMFFGGHIVQTVFRVSRAFASHDDLDTAGIDSLIRSGDFCDTVLIAFSRRCGKSGDKRKEKLSASRRRASYILPLRARDGETEL